VHCPEETVGSLLETVGSLLLLPRLRKERADATDEAMREPVE
jgi:hypothetical protein